MADHSARNEFSGNAASRVGGDGADDVLCRIALSMWEEGKVEVGQLRWTAWTSRCYGDLVWELTEAARSRDCNDALKTP